MRRLSDPGEIIVFARREGRFGTGHRHAAAATSGRQQVGDAWRDRILAWRDTLLMDPTFQRVALAFPLTRPLVRRRTRALFDLCAGFVYSQVLYAAVELGLFEALAQGPATADALADQLHVPTDAMARMLEAAAALRLVDRRSRSRFGLGVLGAALRSTPGLGAMVAHHSHLYADLADPVALMRHGGSGTALADYWPYAGLANPVALPTTDVARYSALMAASLPMIAAEVLDAYPLRRHRWLLDVGGGEGGFLAAAAARQPTMRFTLFDLPAVADRAQRCLLQAGLGGRAVAFGGDFVADPLPQGADIATLIRVLNDHDDSRVLAILRAVHRALPPGGTLLIAEPMSATPGAEAASDAYFGLYLLAMGRGRPRTPEALGRLLTQAGFRAHREVATRNPLLVRVLVSMRDDGPRG